MRKMMTIIIQVDRLFVTGSIFFDKSAITIYYNDWTLVPLLVKVRTVLLLAKSVPKLYAKLTLIQKEIVYIVAKIESKLQTYIRPTKPSPLRFFDSIA